MDFKDTFFSRNQSLNCNGKLLNMSEPLVMGILNLTPDSFYDGGKHTHPDEMNEKIRKIFDEGAAIIDIGSVSTRPGSLPVTENEEYERLVPGLEYIRENYPEAIISVDTFRSETARKAIDNYKVDIINDITGGEGDAQMFDFISDKKVPYILMHLKGTPETMQKNPTYKDVVNEVLKYLADRVSILIDKGVNDIIVDPGFGFGKTTKHNYQLMASLEVFRTFSLPLMVGISRKSMVYRLSGSDPSLALTGTNALHMYALEKGANILRVHDVKEAKEVISIFNMLKKIENEA